MTKLDPSKLYVLCADCKQNKVEAMAVDGMYRPEIKVYCDDCLDERRAWKEEDEFDEDSNDEDEEDNS